jgi:hypothetical protein
MSMNFTGWSLELRHILSGRLCWDGVPPHLLNTVRLRHQLCLSAMRWSSQRRLKINETIVCFAFVSDWRFENVVT